MILKEANVVENAARLKAYVHVRDEGGIDHAFGPGSVVPDWARKAITNPDVWESAPDQVEVRPTVKPRTKRKSGGSNV